MLNTVPDVARIHMLLFYLLRQHNAVDKDNDSDVYTLYFNAGAIASFIQQIRIAHLLCAITVPSLGYSSKRTDSMASWSSPSSRGRQKKYISTFYSLLEGNTCCLRKSERRKKGKRKERKGRTAQSKRDEDLQV